MIVTDAKSFGEAIRKRRKQLGYTQAFLSEFTGISVSFLSDLENGKPTDDLLARMDTAQTYLEGYPEAYLILTGGNADESGCTEAAVMRDILAERGIPDDRMILEDQAETTKANFRNTAQIIDSSKPVVLISSNYHMDRAVKTAKNAGFSNVLRLPAPSSFRSFGANVLYEVILELNELTLRK